MKKDKFIFWSIVVALGGFLFGFDTAVISGAEKAIQKYWELDSIQHGFTISIALVGTVIGSLLGGIPSDKLGRKTTLYIIGALYLFSSLGTALTDNWYVFLVFRFIGGLGVGASSVTAPIYISEISPAEKRGRLVALFQFNIVFGILLSYFSNYLLGQFGEISWRIMLGVQAIPSLLFLIMLRFVPESPRWLIVKKGDLEQAGKILELINPLTFREDVKAIYQNAENEGKTGNAAILFSMLHRTPVLLAILFAFFNQVSGINAIIYYSPRIFEMTGLGTGSSLLSTVGIGIINFLFTLLAMKFIDRVGRRTLMMIGSFGLIITLSLVSFSFYKSQFDSWSVPVYLFIYIGFFAFSQGAVIWVFISEIFPNQVRAKGQTLGSTTHWIMAALIAFIFPYLAENAGGGNIFLFFSVMMCIQLVFVWRFMPETKGSSLEQIGNRLTSH
ncbi:sugar porter family MFS transporter [Terrimonas pollutisoli]|uniref:sugar porter family MFS transporter n=1 Tax=Terrimonas pollutisoli TaxID=3034147 RepID=UPI0023EAC412|nr:sugar porter family MFS transporter [Terrimonas sp. H1YJ31]